MTDIRGDTYSPQQQNGIEESSWIFEQKSIILHSCTQTPLL